MVVLRYSLERTSDPAALPVRLSDIKSDLRINHNEDDDELQAMIEAAVDKLETDTRRAYITQTWVLKCDQWPAFPLELTRPPLSSVTSITYLDTDDNSQTYASSNYEVDTARTPGVIHLLPDATSLPNLSDRPNNVTVTFVCGYGSTHSDVPSRAKHAIKLLVRHYYDACELSPAYANLVEQLRWGSYP